MCKRWFAAMLLGVAVRLSVPAASLTAQTQFAWPDTTVNVATYTVVEECLAATDRIWHGIEYAGWAPVWRDTMPNEGERYLEPLPAPVMQAAERCAARYDARTAPLSEFALLTKLYLKAGRDADVNVLLARRLRAIGETHQAARAMVLDSVFHLYLDAQPVRLDAAEAILHRPEWSVRDRFARFEAYVWLAGTALSADDTVRAWRVGQALLACADSLTPAERNSTAFRTSGALAISMVRLLSTKAQLLDSLRQSTAAYVRAMRRTWAKATGRPPETLPIIGEHAPPIVGDFWAPADAASRPRPTPGHVALIVSITSVSCFNNFASAVNWGDLSAVQNDGGCFADAAALHRLAQRFPALEITIFTRTGGNIFGYLPPLSPTETAVWLERAAAAWNLPGALAIVAQSPTVRFPAPDDRIVQTSPDSNLVHYRLGKAYLVDQDGIIVWDVDGGIGFGESRDVLRSMWIPMIDVLLHRGTAE